MKTKKPIYKRVWFWIIIVILIIGAFAPKNKNTTIETKIINEITPTSQPTPEFIATFEPRSTPEPTLEPTPEPTSESTDINTIISIIKNNLDINFKDIDVEYDVNYQDNVIAISFSINGLANEAIFYKNGYLPMDDWVNFVDSMIEAQKNTQALVNDLGHPEVSVHFMILNDQNKDNIILGISYGIVIFDGIRDINLFG